jgi:hypothetical protein
VQFNKIVSRRGPVFRRNVRLKSCASTPFGRTVPVDLDRSPGDTLI